MLQAAAAQGYKLPERRAPLPINSADRGMSEKGDQQGTARQIELSFTPVSSRLCSEMRHNTTTICCLLPAAR
jgi:hypothetical protein